MLPLLVTGSTVLDSLQGGRFQEEVGGSAVYTSLAASLFGTVRVIAAVGEDAEATIRDRLQIRPNIDLSELEVLPAPTMRWFADSRSGGENIDYGAEDEIFDLWHPQMPSNFQGWAFIGSMRPEHQLEAARQLGGCQLVAADAMHSYLLKQPSVSCELIKAVSWYFANELELETLGCREPESWRREFGLIGLVVKRGPGGATIYTDHGMHHQPAIFDPPAVDTTGAGDCLAGAMLARWQELGGNFQALPEALHCGVAAATIGISEVGIRAIRQVSRAEVEAIM